MIVLTVVSLIILMQAAETSADCRFSNFDKAKKPIFLESFGKNHLIVDFERCIPISEGSSIEAFCESSFDGIRKRETPKEEEEEGLYAITDRVQITCNSDKISLDTTLYSQLILESPLFCYNNKPRFYESLVEYCSGKGLLCARKSLSIVYAEFCYNEDDMKIEFWHYVAATPSKVLEKQLANNPSNLTNFTEFDTRSLLNWKTENSDPFIPLDIEMTDFEYHNLLVLPNYNETFVSNEIDLVAWWMPLRTNNWRTLGKLIEKRLAVEEFDIYEGVSGEVTFPYAGQCNSNETKKLTDKFGRTPPLYIWKYMKPRANFSDDGFVIIGVNSPFVEIFPKELCVDICNSICWLHDIKDLRKMPVFGYIFCCKADQVRQHLKGFPDILNRNFLFESM